MNNMYSYWYFKTFVSRLSPIITQHSFKPCSIQRPALVCMSCSATTGRHHITMAASITRIETDASPSLVLHVTRRQECVPHPGWVEGLS